jgi:hypothetical protein
LIDFITKGGGSTHAPADEPSFETGGASRHPVVNMLSPLAESGDDGRLDRDVNVSDASKWDNDPRPATADGRADRSCCTCSISICSFSFVEE